MFVDLPLAVGNLQCYITMFPPAAGEQEVEGNPGMQDIIFWHTSELRFILMLQTQMRQHSVLWVITPCCEGVYHFVQISVETEVYGQTICRACTALFFLS